MQFRIVALVALVAAVLAASAAMAAKGPPPPPKTVNGHPVTVVARGIPTPTTFAFGGGQVFVAGFGDEQNQTITGGVYVLRAGKPVKLAGSPPHVFGLAYSRGTLYVSGGGKILAWSGWNGSRFAKSRVVVTGPKGFTDFNGLAVGPNGKLYAGISLGDKKTDDFRKGTYPYAKDVVTVDPASGKISVVATGLRQPWQLAGRPRGRDHAGGRLRLPLLPGQARLLREVRQAIRPVPGALLTDGAGSTGRQALPRLVPRRRQGTRSGLDAALGR